ncbi:MAG: prolyl-tRNA synthetase associated domain-containing protein [Lachnospiraceae bacterium]|nr:prolyl-tRNA synthetase associated domain-containing protein [Candidatus Colinaster equi]
MELFSGKPSDVTGRLDKEIRVYRLLDELGIVYDRIDHEPLMTMEACVEADRVLGAHVCKNLLLCNRQKTDYYLLMMPGDKKFKTKELSAQIGSARLSFADGEDMERLLDITPGSLSVMGLMNDKNNQVKLLIDEDIYNAEYCGCHPCINTSCIKLSLKDILNVYLPAVAHDYTVVKLVGEE